MYGIGEEDEEEKAVMKLVPGRQKLKIPF